MQFTVVVLAPPTAAQGAWSALHFCQAAIAGGHGLDRVFFFQDGVYVASDLACAPADEPAPVDAWQQFAQQHDVELAICVSAGARRGLLDPAEAHRRHHNETNVAPRFVVTGLGQLAEAVVASDRIVTFGP